MADKDGALKVLRQTFLQRINFKFDGGAGDVEITGKSFTKIVDLIENDNMEVKVHPDLDGEGVWRYEERTLYIPRIKGRLDESVVVHEGLHGFFFFENIAMLPIPEEAACFLVDVLYYRMTGLKDARFEHPVYNAAKPIAGAILKANAYGKTSKVAVDKAQWGTLLAAVRADPEYAKLAEPGTKYAREADEE
jgi:hypothetical protein